MTHTDIESTKSHILLAAYQAWGHTRPLCTLAARIVKSRSILVTLVTTRPFFDRVEKEISRNFSPEETSLKSRIRLVALATNEANPMDIMSLNISFATAYETLAKEEPLTCFKTGEQLPAVPSPDVAILDIFAEMMLRSVRKLSKKPVKVYCWMSASATSAYTLFGPAHRNTSGNLRATLEEEAQRTGKSLPEVAEEFFTEVKGKVIHVPGLPPMYDYELSPQEMVIKGPPILGPLQLAAVELINECDGILVATPECYEPTETVRAMREWFAETSRPVYAFGPMLPPFGQNATVNEKKQSANSGEIDELLERALKTHGEHSLVYISFGSVFWSVEPEKIWAFLDVMIEKKIPFIMSHGSPFAQVPDSVKEKVNAFGLGVLSPWSPQQAILAHPATGWFVTHCGFNSIMESLSFGVPMICWPYQADQPQNAVHLTDNLEVAYELIEVRNSLGLKPIYRNGKSSVGTIEAVREEAHRVLDSAFGEDGAKKRAKAVELQTAFEDVWAEGGSSLADLNRFLDTI
ncbi:hypothetical protein PHLCEN_2v6923 [Hermanssonia centrifuga]|uniref:Glycosyltransferase n=1 Tax=Hermanssonia centrifuga TaxID=98765 RepID=A0A2R6NYK5_9APHY|nr:hypothetical protein PHLCEN_2v6923 [Hermanssonia centrifuga]